MNGTQTHTDLSLIILDLFFYLFYIKLWKVSYNL